MGYKFSLKKMFKKAAKVGITAGIGTTSVLGVNDGNPLHGLWAALGSSILTCLFNYVNENFIKQQGL